VKEIWTPQLMSVPTERKSDGGTYFDDEMETREAVATAYADQVRELLSHLNARPDHVVYVASVEERTKMRAVFNSWVTQGALSHNPNIRIDYGVRDGALRVGE